jgi:hypothetical protein
MTIAFVYKWTQLSTGMWYIGSRSSKGCHPDDGYICSSKIVRPLIEANLLDWERTILYIDEPKKIREKESSILQELNAKQDPLSYNRHNNDGNFFPQGPLSEETKRKIGKANKGRVFSEEIRLKMGNRIVSEETRRKMRTRTHSEETRLKMSEASKGRTHSEETRLKIGELSKIKTHTEETKRKISARLMGNKGRHGPHSEETKRKISEAKKGRVFSEEHRRKLSEARQKRFSINSI